MPDILEIGPDNFTVYAEEILKIERASFAAPWSLNAFRAEVEKTVSHLWVLASDEKVLGYICFWLLEGEIQLINIAVCPECRRSGLGQFLLEELIREGVSRGVQSVWLEVRRSNSAAINLYGKMGFIKVGIRPKYYSETNEDAIMMSLELPAYAGGT
jgi:[ribosomal protein S18]-alanine N-acetyltransferase